jgi:hypothetical protein
MTATKLDTAIDLAASLTTLVGMWLGSTTLVGAIVYLISTAFWFTLMFRRRMWGLAPLNVAALFISVINIVRSGA